MSLTCFILLFICFENIYSKKSNSNLNNKIEKNENNDNNLTEKLISNMENNSDSEFISKKNKQTNKSNEFNETNETNDINEFIQKDTLIILQEKQKQQNIFNLIICMILLNITMRGAIAVYETLGAQILEIDYQISIFAIGVIISVAGTIGTINLLLFKSFWTKYFNDIELILLGTGLMILSQFIILSYNNQIPTLYRYLAGK